MNQARALEMVVVLRWVSLGALLFATVGCGSQVGDPCTTLHDCAGGTCLNDAYAPGGDCSKNCEPDAVSSGNGVCPDSSTCVRSGKIRSYSTCLRECDQPGDCRDGYVCQVVEGSTRAVCIGP